MNTEYNSLISTIFTYPNQHCVVLIGLIEAKRDKVQAKWLQEVTLFHRVDVSSKKKKKKEKRNKKKKLGCKDSARRVKEEEKKW
jgi:hypothetical protein